MAFNHRLVSPTTVAAAAVEQQGAAKATIARNVQKTTASTEMASTNTVGAADLVLGAVRDLFSQAESLTVEVNKCVGGMPAA